MATQGAVPQASARDTVAVVNGLLLPFVARGAIARRPRVVGLEERMDADRRAVRLLQRLRSDYGSGPLLLRVPTRTMALILSPDDVIRVLHGAPEPFAPATREKRAALRHFQPHGVLASDPDRREVRRPFNERVLEPDRPMHDHADVMIGAIREEAEQLRVQIARDGVLDWDRAARAVRAAARRASAARGAGQPCRARCHAACGPRDAS